MSEYTPTTDQIRGCWQAGLRYDGHPTADETGAAEFDRWLNEVKADAWDEGHRACQRDWEFAYDLVTADEEREPWTNSYREDQS